MEFSQHTNRLVAVAATLVTALLVSGCGATTVSSNGQEPSASRNADQSLKDLGGVIVGASCGESVISLFAIPEQGGDFVARKDLVLTDGVSPTFSCGDSPYAFRQDFNGDFSRMAVTIRNADDQSEHVGYIDTDTGKVTDLERDTTDQFAAAIQDHSPVFDPSSGDIWYVSGNPNGMTVGRVERMNPNGGAATETDQHLMYAGQDSFALAGTSGTIVTPDNSSGFPLPNPSGTVTAAYSSIGGAGLGPALTLVDTADPNGGHGYEQHKLLSLEGSDLPGNGLTPLVWRDNRTLITSVDNSTMTNTTASSFESLVFSPDHRSVVASGRVIPDGDRTNISPVISPDHKVLAFLSYRGNTGGIYTTRLTGASTPIKLQQTPYPQVLLQWQ